MSDYTQVNDYSTKDALASGDPNKKILGADIDAELSAISTAIASKANSASPTFTGTVTIPTPAGTSNTTVAASTAFVRNIFPAGLIVPYGGSTSPDTDIWLLCDGSAVSRTTYATLFDVISTTFGAGDGSTTFNVPDLRGRTPLGAGTGTLAENTAAADVDTTADTFLVASNTDKWITGMAVVLTTTGSLPGGLSLATTYYVIRSDSTHIKFASSLANAVAGTAIDITSIGSGTHTTTHTLTARTLGQKLGEESHASTVAEMAVHTHTDAGHNHTERGSDSGGTLRDLRNQGGAGGGTTYELEDGGGAQIRAVSNASDNNAGTLWTTADASASLSNTGSSNAHNNMQPGLVLNYLIKT